MVAKARQDHRLEELEQLGEESLAGLDDWLAALKKDLADLVQEKGSLEDAMKGLESLVNRRSQESGNAFARWLTPALVVALLAGFADVQADAARDVSDPSIMAANAAPTISAGYDVKFKEAIDFFQRKGVVTPEQFRALEAAAKARAFTVGQLSDTTAIEKVKASLLRAIESGQMPNDWLTGLEEQFKSSGLDISGNASYWRTVYRQNTYQAYGAGRWQQMQKVKTQRPFWQFVTVGDDRVRPEHAILDGTILPADDPWWQTHYPPLGFGCRCMVVSVSREEIEEEGLSVSDPGELPYTPSADGFSANPAEAFGGLEALL